jgi:hypothetical protein
MLVLLLIYVHVHVIMFCIKYVVIACVIIFIILTVINIINFLRSKYKTIRKSRKYNDDEKST